MNKSQVDLLDTSTDATPPLHTKKSIRTVILLFTVNLGYNKPPVQRAPGYNEPSRWAPP